MRNSTFFSLCPPSGKLQKGFCFLAFQTLILPSFLAFLPSSISGGMVNFLYFLISFLMVTILYRHYLLDSLKAAGKQLPGIALWAAIFFIALRLCDYLLKLCIQTRFPDFYNLNDAAIGALVRQDFWPMAIGTVVLVPVTEELLHRTTLFRGLYSRSPAAAWIVSVLMFALIHVTNYVGADPLTLALCFVQYLPAGICLAAAYRLSGSILTPILIHAGINTLGILALR